jgi:hypothetical protein
MPNRSISTSDEWKIKRHQQRRDPRAVCFFNKVKLAGTFSDIRISSSYSGKQGIDYINTIEKLRTGMRDTREFGGSEIDTDHYPLQRKFNKQYYIKKRNIKSIKATEN